MSGCTAGYLGVNCSLYLLPLGWVGQGNARTAKTAAAETRAVDARSFFKQFVQRDQVRASTFIVRYRACPRFVDQAPHFSQVALLPGSDSLPNTTDLGEKVASTTVQEG